MQADLLLAVEKDAYSAFTLVERPTGLIWQHNTKPSWIVFYDTKHRKPFYEAYTVSSYIKTLPKNRNTWTLDNIKLSDGDGFATFEMAAAAVENDRSRE